MSHKEQQDFCLKIKNLYPHYFYKKIVLDVGSLDINGSNRDLFIDCDYCGIDVGEGQNVDVVCKAHELDKPNGFYQTIISTECFEHDMFYKKSLKKIIKLLAKNGMFLFTCATTGRAEHGTNRCNPVDAPLLANHNDWSDYYKNLTEEDIREAINVDKIFKEYAFEVNDVSHDLYFWGIKK